jgi:sigma-B regulation protein RsbU (phosphoserine phosphatase)
VGGDLYSYHCRDRRLFIAVGDVSDKGVPAALFMARAISLIQQLAATSRDPAVAMAALNNALASGNDNCMFVTLFLGIVNLDTLELHFSSAGHTRPSLVRAGRALSIEQEQGPALGLVAQLDFPRNLLQLQDGDRLAIFTDGIDEAFNEEDEMFGLARFNETLLECRALPPAAAGASLFTALHSFTGETPQSDDICLLLLGIGGDAPGVRTTFEFARGPGLAMRVDTWLRQVLEPLLLSQQVLGELVLVAEEAVSNADKYAGLAADAAITVTVDADPIQVALEVRDAGLAFNPLLQAQQSVLGAAIEDAAVGGLGVHLITALTDHQSYHRADGCNILRLIKLLEHHPDQAVK